MRRTPAQFTLDKRARSKRILALIPEAYASSDISGESSNEENDVYGYISSPAPSIDSSLERIIDWSDSPVPSINTYCEEDSDKDIPSHIVIETEAEINHSAIDNIQICTPISSALEQIFPNSTECNYGAIPSITSLPSLPSLQQSPANINTPLHVPRKRKIRKSTVVATKVKKQKTQRLRLVFRWKKTKFQYSANIQETVFNEEIPADWTALDYFYRFFPSDLIDDITTNTNLYSVQETGKSIKVSNEDILDFLAINILMGIVDMPSYKDYWSTSFRYAKIADIMPLKRFEQIRRYIHFTDNHQAEQSDRYYKLRPLLERVRQQCVTVEEENAFSIDEMIIPYKGKKAGSRRQYNPNKPCKWGFKNFVRAGVSGIIYDFMLYAGDDTFRGIQFESDEENLGVGAKTVLALCKSIRNRPCVVYFDNWFSSLELIYILRENYGIFSLGTIRKNRLQDANALLLSDKIMQKKGRGTYCQAVCNENKLAVVKWYDNKAVTLVSSYVDAYPVEKIKRFEKVSKGRVDISCPQIVKHYNRHMGGVDLADMLISLYRTAMKSHRWYLNIFSQILDICVNNGWLLRRRHRNKKKKDDHLKQFRYEVFMGLTRNNRSITKINDVVSEGIRIKKPIAERPTDSVRYDKYDHWPEHAEYQRCKLCKKGQASTRCTKCNIHLCYVAKRNCFVTYHQK